MPADRSTHPSWTRRLRHLLTGRARFATLAAALVAALALAPGLARLETDNSPSVFFVEGSPGVARYEQFRERFGSDKMARLAISGPEDTLWSAEALTWLGEIERRAAEVEGVEAASGFRGHYGGEDGSRWPPSDPEAFRRRVVGPEGATADRVSMDRELGWVGDEGRVLSVLLLLDADGNRAKVATLGRLESLLEEAPPPAGLTARLAGTPVLDRALDASSREIERRYFPMLVALAVLLLVLTFRGVRPVLVPLAFVALNEVLLLGIMGWVGVRLNLVLAVLPPLVFVISLATAIHVLVRYRDFLHDGLEPVEAVVETYRDKGWAVLWTGVSTLVGFASLAVSKVGPVRTLGIWAGVGMALMIVLAFGVYPALLPAAGAAREDGRASRAFESFFQRRGRRWAEWAAHHRRGIQITAGILAMVALLGLPRVQVETNALHYLPLEHPVRSDIEDLQARGVGMIAVELMLDGPPGTFDRLESFGRLSELTGELRRESGVLGAAGAGDLLDDAVRQAPGGGFFGASQRRRMVFDRLTGADGEADVIGQLVTDDGAATRVTVFTESLGDDRLRPLLARMEELARQAFPEVGQDGAVATGEYALVLESQRQLLRTLGLSLGLTILVVGLIFRVLLRSTRLTVLALVPNLWPVVGVVGIMGWAGIPLDVATVMVASVVLGLAVDDTIHTLGHFRELAPRVGKLEALAGTLERTAPSYVLTGLVLGAGFGVCALSDFAPTSRFGLLSAIAIALAVLGDLFLLPALLGSTPEAVVGRLQKSTGRDGGAPL